MTQKRILIVLLAMITAISLSSCGGKDSDVQDEIIGFISDQDYRYTGNGYGDFPSLDSFTAVTDDGSSFSPDDLASRDMTLINIWATWCGPCLSELPELSEFAQLLPGNIGFVTICVDGYEDTDNMGSLLKKAGYKGRTIISGSGDIGNLVASALYVPTTVFVDSKGQIAGSLVGSPRENLPGNYLAALNKVLEASGLQRISLPGVEEAVPNE